MIRKSLLALTLAVAVAGPARATIETMDNVPAATLLLPFFEVNPNNANPHTVVSVGNASNADVLAHVVLWTDQGVPTYSFDVRLGAYAVEQIDLGALFTNGTVPITTVGTFSGCSGILPTGAIAGATLTGLRDAHGGEPSSLFGGNCAGEDHGDNLVRGYLTIDSMSNCSASIKFPADSGYFTAGGTGLANNANVLFGSVQTYDSTAGWAHGDGLVAIEASASDVTTDGTTDSSIPDYTFYARVIGSAADNREALPLSVNLTNRVNHEWIGRYVLNGVFTDTTAIVWRDPGAASSFVCNTPPAGLSQSKVVLFDDKEEPAATCNGVAAAFPLAAQSVDIGDPTRFDAPFDAGFIQYDLSLAQASGALGIANQSFVTHVARNATDRASLGAWPLLAENDNVVPCGPCTDGLDNDGDGDIDFPNDADCRSKNAATENPQCSDGVDNDGTGGTDFPNDPECWGPLDNSEDTTGASGSAQCDDGVDNDGDNLVDWPLDSNCSSPVDDIEAPGQCSDGVDNDSDGDTDFPNDPGCSSASDNNETNAVCNDGLDNDSDGDTDFPNDSGCSSATDTDETNYACNDGLDNDNDGDTDFPNDAACTSIDTDNEGPECDDGVDNDSDGDTDFPNDAGCASATAPLEGTQCDDGVDNDSDGDTDFPNDAGCSAATSNVEAPACDDGSDNDTDTLTDFPSDPGCASASSTVENPACDDTVDNDFDGDIDFPNDADCSSASATTESGAPVPPACNDGNDNDSDGKVDFPNDASCSSALDNSESSDCADGLDNDADGLVDAGQNGDPGCANAADENELGGATVRLCSDGIDNDSDGKIDVPADSGCSSANDDLEFAPGDVVVQVVPFNKAPAASDLGLALIASFLALVGILGLRRPLRG